MGPQVVAGMMSQAGLRRDVFPGWLQPVVRAQPMSAIEAVRALADGGPTLWPVLQSLAWIVGLIAMFGADGRARLPCRGRIRRMT
jgi:hypothetical protein